MNKVKHIFAICLAFAFFCSCQGNRQGGASPEGDTLALDYAQLLTIVEYDGYSVASIRDPWNKGRMLHEYVLLPKGTEVPSGFEKATIVRTPVSNALIYTAVHSALAVELGAGKQIGGVCDFQYIHSPFIIDGVHDGSIKDCGDAMTPDLERIIDLEPDVVLLSPFENSGGYGRVEELGVPLIECADYMESSPLGRAEWMKFYGRLFGVGDEADQLFRQVNDDYLQMKAKAADANEKPSVIADMKIGSVWYVPGGQSTQGKLWADANAVYPYADDSHSGSLALSFEAVFDKAGDANIWVIRYNQPVPLTYRQLAADYHGNAELKAFKERRVYGCNTGHTAFYEETPFHPDRLLRDYIQICHPEMELGGLKYFEKIEE